MPGVTGPGVGRGRLRAPSPTLSRARERGIFIVRVGAGPRQFVPSGPLDHVFQWPARCRREGSSRVPEAQQDLRKAVATREFAYLLTQ